LTNSKDLKLGIENASDIYPMIFENMLPVVNSVMELAPNNPSLPPGARDAYSFRHCSGPSGSMIRSTPSGSSYFKLSRAYQLKLILPFFGSIIDCDIKASLKKKGMLGRRSSPVDRASLKMLCNLNSGKSDTSTRIPNLFKK
jgi:hypothetical protein